MSSQDNATRSGGGTPAWRQLLPSSTSLFLIAYIILGLFMNGGFKPIRRGFFCNDTTIQYPFKSDTISFKVLLIIALFIPWIVIKLLEKKLFQLTNDYTTRPRSKSTDSNSGPSNNRIEGDEEEEEKGLMDADRVKRRLVVNEDDSDLEACETEATILASPAGSSLGGGQDSGCGVRPVNGQRNGTTILDNVISFRMMLRRSAARKIFSDSQVFFFGFATTSFMSGIGKIAGGRLRPHFLERCKPNIDCSLTNNAHRYIQDFECTNQALRSRDYSYITSSWPSGHAAIMFYSMLYLIFYLNTVIPAIARMRAFRRRPRVGFSPLLMNSIYVLMIGLAIYVSLTRVSDYHHHPTDVMSGSILGTIVATVIANHVYKPAFRIPGPRNLLVAADS